MLSRLDYTETAGRAIARMPTLRVAASGRGSAQQVKEDRLRRLAIINQKGGVGKTTTTANLGAALARAGKRVLLLDLDPQAHLTLCCGVDLTDEQPSLYDVLTNEATAAEAIVKVNERISILPTNIDLAGVEARLINTPGREMILREALAGLSEPYDVVMIDCPPALGVLTINALVAATEVVIPLQAHFFALQGLSKLLETVTLVRQRINPQLHVSGVVLCLYESATRLGAEVVDDLRKFLEAARGSAKPWSTARLFDTAIRRNIKLAESPSYGQTVFEYAPKSNGAIDYANLAAEMFNLRVEDCLGADEAATCEAAATRAAEAAPRGEVVAAAEPTRPPPVKSAVVAAAGPGSGSAAPTNGRRATRPAVAAAEQPAPTVEDATSPAVASAVGVHAPASPVGPAAAKAAGSATMQSADQGGQTPAQPARPVRQRPAPAPRKEPAPPREPAVSRHGTGSPPPVSVPASRLTEREVAGSAAPATGSP